MCQTTIKGDPQGHQALDQVEVAPYVMMKKFSRWVAVFERDVVCIHQVPARVIDELLATLQGERHLHDKLTRLCNCQAVSRIPGHNREDGVLGTRGWRRE
jgi:hypothetical protein